MTPFYIYLWGTVDNLRDVAIGLIVFPLLVAVITSGVILGMGDGLEDKLLKQLEKLRKIAAYLLVLACLIRALVPTSTTLACMIVLPEIAASKAIQKDAPELYNIAIEALKKSIIPTK